MLDPLVRELICSAYLAQHTQPMGVIQEPLKLPGEPPPERQPATSQFIDGPGSPGSADH